MKKALISVIATLMIGCGVQATPIPILTSTPEPTPVVEPLENKLMGVKIVTNGKTYVIGLAYDTDNNGFPDTFETYLGHKHNDSWIHKHELIYVNYNNSEDNL